MDRHWTKIDTDLSFGYILSLRVQIKSRRITVAWVDWDVAKCLKVIIKADVITSRGQF